MPDTTQTRATAVNSDYPPQIELTPVSRRYGKSYQDSAALDLTHLATWLLAEMTVRCADPALGLRQPRYAMLVNVHPSRPALFFRVFDTDLHESDDDAASAAVRDFRRLARLVFGAHNYSNPRDPSDVRFVFDGLALVGADLEATLRAEGRGPGTITVIDSGQQGWWWR